MLSNIPRLAIRIGVVLVVAILASGWFLLKHLQNDPVNHDTYMDIRNSVPITSAGCSSLRAALVDDTITNSEASEFFERNANANLLRDERLLTMDECLSQGGAAQDGGQDDALSGAAPAGGSVAQGIDVALSRRLQECAMALPQPDYELATSVALWSGTINEMVNMAPNAADTQKLAIKANALMATQLRLCEEARAEAARPK